MWIYIEIYSNVQIIHHECKRKLNSLCKTQSIQLLVLKVKLRSLVIFQSQFFSNYVQTVTHEYK